MTHPKHAVSDHEILDVIRHRWSPRAFADRPVAPADLQSIFEAARWAPSSYNEQPWRFVVADRHRDAGAFARMADTLASHNRGWASQASVLILVSINTRLTSTGTLNQAAAYDAGQAVAFLTIQATSLGLSLRQMEGFSRDLARDACGVPAEYEPIVVMALGYAGDPQSLEVERHRAGETTPRQRRPVNEFVYNGAWGVPLRAK